MLVVMGDKREYGTGTLYIDTDGCWWARWRTRDGRRPHRKLGTARTPGRREGLTKKEAEGKLRELMLADNGGERSRARAAPTVEEMGEALIARMRRDDLKKGHIETGSGHLRKHIDPLLGDMLVSEVVEADTDRLVTRLTNANSLRHSRDRLRRVQLGVQTLSGLLFPAWDDVAVAVPGLTNIAVSRPRRDLLPVEAGGDEVGDRAVAGLVRRNRLEPGLEPCLVRSGADRGGEERLGVGAAEYKVRAVALRSLLVGHEFAADDEGHRDCAAAGAGLDVDRALDRIPGALDSDHTGVEVDVAPLEYAMRWSEVAARSHARRLEREGWLERWPMTWGEGSLFLATRKGMLVWGCR
jgi:hypothetical protein